MFDIDLTTNILCIVGISVLTQFFNVFDPSYVYMVISLTHNFDLTDTYHKFTLKDIDP